MNTVNPAIPELTSKNKWNNTTFNIIGNSKTKDKGTYLLDKSMIATTINIMLVNWSKYPVFAIATKKSVAAWDNWGGVTNRRKPLIPKKAMATPRIYLTTVASLPFFMKSKRENCF